MFLPFYTKLKWTVIIKSFINILINYSNCNMSFKFKDYQDQLILIPLGGCNEIGANFNLYGYKGKWIIIDCGAGFADADLPGVDMIVPDVKFIEKYKNDIVGIILTHAHEDHIGGVQYLWNSLGCPIYTTRFTLIF